MATNEDLSILLWQKMESEQDRYRTWLTSLPSSEILHHAWEYTVRQDIMYALEEHDLPAIYCKKLLESPTPLADVYRVYCKMETGYMDEIRESISYCAQRMIMDEKAKKDSENMKKGAV